MHAEQNFIVNIEIQTRTFLHHSCDRVSNVSQFPHWIPAEHTLTVTTQAATYRFSYILLAIGKQWYPRMAHRARLVRMPIQWNYFHPRGKGANFMDTFRTLTRELEGIVRDMLRAIILGKPMSKPYLTEYFTAATQEHGTNREFKDGFIYVVAKHSES